MTVQTAVLIETLTALGAEVTWTSCNIFRRRITLPLRSPRRACRCSHGRAKAKKSTSTALRCSFVLSKAAKPEHDPRRRWRSTWIIHEKHPHMLTGPDGIRGLSEETTTGVHRLYEAHKSGKAQGAGDQRQRLGD